MVHQHATYVQQGLKNWTANPVALAGVDSYLLAETAHVPSAQPDPLRENQALQPVNHAREELLLLRVAVPARSALQENILRPEAAAAWTAGWPEPSEPRGSATLGFSRRSFGEKFHPKKKAGFISLSSLSCLFILPRDLGFGFKE